MGREEGGGGLDGEPDGYSRITTRISLPKGFG